MKKKILKILFIYLLFMDIFSNVMALSESEELVEISDETKTLSIDYENKENEENNCQIAEETCSDSSEIDILSESGKEIKESSKGTGSNKDGNSTGKSLFDITITKKNIDDEEGGWKTFIYEISRCKINNEEGQSNGDDIEYVFNDDLEEFVTYAFISYNPEEMGNSKSASIVIKNLSSSDEEGNKYLYKIREIDEWSWRYKSNEKDKVKLLIDSEYGYGIVAEFTGKAKNNRWLSSSDDSVWVGTPYNSK